MAKVENPMPAEPTVVPETTTNPVEKTPEAPVVEVALLAPTPVASEVNVPVIEEGKPIEEVTPIVLPEPKKDEVKPLVDISSDEQEEASVNQIIFETGSFEVSEENKNKISQIVNGFENPKKTK